MLVKDTRRNRVITQVLATVLVAPFALPLLWILLISFDGQGAVANYSAVMSRTPFLRFLVNSVIISSGVIALVTVCTMLASYALAKLRLPAREAIFMSILVGLMLPAVALIIPLFQFVVRFQLFNTYLSVILPLSAVILPMTILLGRNYIMGVPDELLEAARVDGASSFGILWRVLLPLCGPIISVTVVWSFLNSWNEFLLPLLFLQDPAKQAITQVPTYFTSTYGSDVPKIFAALVLMCLPITAAYLSLQRFFERGLTAGALK